MFVVFSLQNTNHCVSGNPVFSRKVSHCHAGLWKFDAPSNHLLIGEVRRWVILTNPAMSTRRLAALFVVAILDVIGVVAKPKMGRIYAAAVSYVANWVAFVAAMAYKLTFWNGAVVNFVGKTRRYNGDSSAISHHIQLPVPFVIGAGSPKPAVIRPTLVDLGPKTINARAEYPDFVVVPNNETHGAIGYMAAFSIRLIRNWSKSVTSALASAILGKQPAPGNPRGVVLKIGRKVRRSAVNLWLLVVGFWGTILHVASPFLTIGHAAGLFQQPLRLLAFRVQL